MESFFSFFVCFNSLFFLCLLFLQNEKTKDPGAKMTPLEKLTWGSFWLEFACLLIQVKNENL
jgi:hypothetical protein